MNNLKTTLFAIILGTSFTGIALAEPHDNGAYIEGNIGTLYASTHFWGVNYTYFGSVGANANVGYLFNRYFATEMGYTNYTLSRDSLNNVDVALKGILPFTIQNHDVSLFAKVGPAYVFSGGSGEVVPFAGIGASYRLTSHLDANIQAQGLTNGFFSLGLISGGLTYYFN